MADGLYSTLKYNQRIGDGCLEEAAEGPRHSTGVHAQSGLAAEKTKKTVFGLLPVPPPSLVCFFFFPFLLLPTHSLHALFVPAILPPITHFLYFHQTNLFISISHHGRQRRPGMFIVAPRRPCAPPRLDSPSSAWATQSCLPRLF